MAGMLPRVGPDFTKLIPGVIIERLWELSFEVKHVARDTNGNVWMKDPGDDWERVDLLSLALAGRTREMSIVTHALRMCRG